MKTTTHPAAPLTGQSHFTPKPAAPPASPTPETLPNLRSWNLRGLKNTRATVIAQVHSAATVPAVWKAAIIASLNDLDPRIELVSLDFHVHYGVAQGRTQLVISGGISSL